MIKTNQEIRAFNNVCSLVLFVLLLAVFSSPLSGHEPEEIDEKLEQGRRLFEAGNLLQAATFFEEIVTSKHNNPTAQNLLFVCYRFIGIEYYGQSRCQDAIDAWSKALIIDPHNLEIQGFITRCESEQRAIANISGDTTLAESQAPSPKVIQKVRVDTVFVKTPSKVDSITVLVDKSDPTILYREINCGLSYGIAVNTISSQEPKTGTTLSGFVSILPAKYWLGLRVEGNYSRFYRNSENPVSTMKYMTIAGGSVSVVITSGIFHSSFIDCSTGLGTYETILTESGDNLSSDVTQKSSSIGINLGLGWRKELGRIAATVDVKFIHLYRSHSPKLLQLSLGITSI